MSDAGFRERNATPPTIELQQMRRIMVEGDAQTLVDQAQEFGHAIKIAGLTKSQIRGIFGTVRQMEARWNRQKPQENLRDILLLKPRLAYQGAREVAVRPLAKVLSEAIDFVAEDKDVEIQRLRFGYFVDLFEAILAYHTAAGGR